MRHVVDESLLSEACAAGGVTPALRERVEEILLTAVEEQDAAVMVCTCSSIGSVAEAVNGRTQATLMRIDRPMAAEAVMLGSRIIVAATLSTTLIPTRELILSVAHEAGKRYRLSNCSVTPPGVSLNKAIKRPTCARLRTICRARLRKAT